MKKEVDRNKYCAVSVADGNLGRLICLELDGTSTWMTIEGANHIIDSLIVGIKKLEDLDLDLVEE